MGGYIDHAAINAVRRGYAGSSTDMGHRIRDGKWWLGHPEKVTDFGYRAIHETAVKSTVIIVDFYGAGSVKSYFDCCSNGGLQGLMEAQLYPSDYDGITFTSIICAVSVLVLRSAPPRGQSRQGVVFCSSESSSIREQRVQVM